MSHMQVNPTFGSSGLIGGIPGEWVGVDLPDGDRWPWVAAPVGSIYRYKPNETRTVRVFTKRQNNGRDDDWGGSHTIQQYVTVTNFTDGLSTAGTLNLTETIPAGAFVTQVLLQNLTGFTGDASCTLLVGESGDTDRYMTGTPSIFTTAVAVDLGVPSGTKIHTAAKTVLLTATSGTDWGLVTAGNFTIQISYTF